MDINALGEAIVVVDALLMVIALILLSIALYLWIGLKIMQKKRQQERMQWQR